MRTVADPVPTMSEDEDGPATPRGAAGVADPEEDAMYGQATESPAAGDRSMLIRGIALLSVGSGLMLVGALLTSVVAVRVTRRWVRQWDEPPRAVARRRLSQARSAVSAGTRGWREDGRAAVPASVGSEG